MKRLITAGAAVALAVSLAGCGKADSSGDDGAASAPGVTEDTIKIGALLDLTNVFAPNSKAILQGVDLYWKQVNDDGGVCGRTVEVDTQDHEYDPQKAVTLYRDMSGDVLALAPVLGSSVMTALLPSYEQDDMLVGMMAWTADVLPNPLIMIPGATYDIEVINGVDWLMREGRLKKGDAVGIVYFEGDFGGNAAAGLDYAAKETGLSVVKHQIKPTDTDLTAQVNAMKAKDVKAIFIAAGSPQTSSVATVAASTGLDVPIIGNSPSFTPALMDTPAGPALAENFYTSSSIAPAAADTPEMKEYLDAFEKAYPDELPVQNGSNAGYAQAAILHQALEGACDDLTREGLQKSFREIDDYQHGTIAGTLDFTDPAQPPTRETYLSKADKSAPGYLTVVEEPFVSELAEGYTFGD